MDAVEKKQFEDKVALLEKQNKEFSDAKAVIESANVKALADLAKIKADTRRASFAAFVEENIKKITPANRELFITIMENLPEGKFQFSADKEIDGMAQFKAYVGQMKDVIPSGKPTTGKETGKETNAEDEGRKTIRQFMIDNKVDLRAATIAVSKEHPELFMQE